MTKQELDVYEKKLKSVQSLMKQQMFGLMYGMNTDNQNKNVDSQNLRDKAYENVLAQYSARDAEVTAMIQGWAEGLKNTVAKTILEHIICEYPFPYIDMTQVTGADVANIQEDPKVGFMLMKLIRERKNEYKVAIDYDTMDFFVQLHPEFFDGMDLEEAPITREDLGSRITGYLSPSARFTGGGKNIQYAASSVKVLKYKKEPEAECPVCGFVDKLTVKKCKKCGTIFEDESNIGS